MISVHFQGKPFNITVIQVYAPSSNAEEAEVEWFYEDLQKIHLSATESYGFQIYALRITPGIKDKRLSQCLHCCYPSLRDGR